MTAKLSVITNGRACALIIPGAPGQSAHVVAMGAQDAIALGLELIEKGEAAAATLQDEKEPRS